MIEQNYVKAMSACAVVTEKMRSIKSHRQRWPWRVITHSTKAVSTKDVFSSPPSQVRWMFDRPFPGPGRKADFLCLSLWEGAGLCSPVVFVCLFFLSSRRRGRSANTVTGGKKNTKTELT